MSSPKGVSDHPAKEKIEDLWRRGLRAKEIIEWLQQNDFPVISAKTLSRYGQRYWSSTTVETTTNSVEDLQDVVTELQSVGVVRKISLRESVTKTGLSKSQIIEVVPNAQTFSFERGPVKPLKFNYRVSRKASKPEGWKVGVFLPDMQIGYWNDGRECITTHDESAIDVAHQIMADVQAMYGLDLVINAGDNMDLPVFGTHRNAPGFLTTTQMVIDRTTDEGAMQRALAPDAKIVWIEGNHEYRLTKYLVDKATPLVGLARGNETKPLVSIKSFCRFDEFNIDYLEPYPDAEYWVNEHLRFEHGSLYSSTSGGTAAKYLSAGVSVGYGHIHRQELLQQTRHTQRGPRTHFAGSPGCLCRIDGAVPSSKTGITSSGKQAVQRTENWQNGMWVFWWQPEGDQLVSIEPVSIWGGWAMFRGKEFFATVDQNGNSL